MAVRLRAAQSSERDDVSLLSAARASLELSPEVVEAADDAQDPGGHGCGAMGPRDASRTPSPTPAGMAEEYPAVIIKLVLAEPEEAQHTWRWDAAHVTIMTDDMVIWKWNTSSAPMHLNVTAADQHFRPLPAGNPLALKNPRPFTSGEPASAGKFEHRFESPGTYYYCSSVGASSVAEDPRWDGPVHRQGGCGSLSGVIFVRSEWQKAVQAMVRKEWKLACISAGLWLLMLTASELVLAEVSRSAASQYAVTSSGEPLRAVVLALLPRALRWAIPPGVLGLLLLGISLSLALVRSVKSPKLKSFGRGYTPRTHLLVLRCIFGVVTALCILILMGWVLTIVISAHGQQFAQELSNLITANVDFLHTVLVDAHVMLQDVAQHDVALAASIDTFVLEAGASAYGFGGNASAVLQQASTLANCVQLLALETQDILSGLLETLLFLDFFLLQAVAIVAAVGCITVLFRQAISSRAMGWLASYGLVCVLLNISVLSSAAVVHAEMPAALRAEARKLTDSKVGEAFVLGDSPAYFQVVPILVEVQEYCTGANSSIPRMYLDAVLDAVDAVAEQLNLMAGQVVLLVPPEHVRRNMTFRDVRDLLEAISFELYSLRFIDTSTEVAPDTNFTDTGETRVPGQWDLPGVKADRIRRLGPSLRVGVALLEKVARFLQCETLASFLLALGNVYAQLNRLMWLALYLKLGFSVVLAALVVLSFIGSHVLDRPRKYYYAVQSGRWFRFRATYKAHLRCWKRSHDGIEQLQRALENLRTEARGSSLMTRVYAKRSTVALGRELAGLQEAARHNLRWHAPLRSERHVQQMLGRIHAALLVFLVAFSLLLMILLWWRNPVSADGILNRHASVVGAQDTPVADLLLASVWLCALVPVAGLEALALEHTTQKTQEEQASNRKWRRVLRLGTSMGLFAAIVLFALSLMSMSQQFSALLSACNEARDALRASLDKGSSLLELLSLDGTPSSEDVTMSSPSGGALSALHRACRAKDMSVLVVWIAVAGMGACISALACVSGMTYTAMFNQSMRTQAASERAHALMRSISHGLVSMPEPGWWKPKQSCWCRLVQLARCKVQLARHSCCSRWQRAKDTVTMTRSRARRWHGTNLREMGRDTETSDIEASEAGKQVKQKAKSLRGDKTGKGYCWYATRVLVMATVSLTMAFLTIRLTVRDEWTHNDGVQERRDSTLHCNGYLHLCERAYDQVSYATVHNAMSSLDDGFAVPNNYRGMDLALKAGARALMLDVVSTRDEGARLCHQDCSLGKIDIINGFVRIRKFLEENPRDVISIIFEEIPLNGIDVLKSQVSLALNISGLAPFLYSPTPRSISGAQSHISVPSSVSAPWPTLGEMVERGERLVIFSDRRAGVTESAMPWDLHLWDYAVETHYSFFLEVQLAHTASSCAFNRGNSNRSLFIVNHFVTNPLANPFLAKSVNYNLLSARAQDCANLHNRRVNFLVVDFWSESNLIGSVAAMNS